MSVKPFTWLYPSALAQALRSSLSVSGPKVLKAKKPSGSSTRRTSASAAENGSHPAATQELREHLREARRARQERGVRGAREFHVPALGERGGERPSGRRGRDAVEPPGDDERRDSDERQCRPQVPAPKPVEPARERLGLRGSVRRERALEPREHPGGGARRDATHLELEELAHRAPGVFPKLPLEPCEERGSGAAAPVGAGEESRRRGDERQALYP